MIPESWNVEIRDFIPKNSSDSPVLYKLNFKDGFTFNNATPKLEKHLNDNPYNLDADRLQEIKAIDRLIKYSRSDITVACPESIVITNNHGKKIDEWDGLMLQIDESEIKLTVIETKNFQGSTKKNENEAIKQLDNTRINLTKKFQPKYIRNRIKNIGARLILNLNS